MEGVKCRKAIVSNPGLSTNEMDMNDMVVEDSMLLLNFSMIILEVLVNLLL